VQVLTTGRLLAAGLSARQIRRLVIEGGLAPLRPGVYARTEAAGGPAAGAAVDVLLPLAAALAVTGSRSVGSHQTAAAVHTLSLVDRPSQQLIHVTRASADRGSRTRRRPGVLVHNAALPDEHVTSCRGVPVTSVARTVVDLARTVPFAEGVAVADSALQDKLQDKLATRGELEAVVARCERWPGIQRARRVVAFADPLAESVLESISRVAFHEHGLPAPELQVWVGDAEEIAGRVDFLWREQRTIAEADGAIKYTGPARALAQLNRDARLREAGFEVVHFTWPEITRVPAQVVMAIRAAFRRQESGTRRG
jgi:predicted transcriptional regulator of viral defense system